MAIGLAWGIASLLATILAGYIAAGKQDSQENRGLNNEPPGLPRPPRIEGNPSLF
jgi:hypothetical protein